MKTVFSKKQDPTAPKFAETFPQYKRRMDAHLANKLAELKETEFHIAPLVDQAPDLNP